METTGVWSSMEPSLGVQLIKLNLKFLLNSLPRLKTWNQSWWAPVHCCPSSHLFLPSLPRFCSAVFVQNQWKTVDCTWTTWELSAWQAEQHFRRQTFSDITLCDGSVSSPFLSALTNCLTKIFYCNFCGSATNFPVQPHVCCADVKHVQRAVTPRTTDS